jgi:hypothetical protein
MSVTFNGTTQYLTIADDAALTLTPPWSLAFWFAILAPNKDAYILGWGTPATASSAYWRYYSAAGGSYPGKIRGYFLDAELDGFTGSSGDVSGSTDWHHCLLTYDGSTRITYIDGEVTLTGSVSGVGAINSADDLYLGRQAGGNHFNGKLAEIAKYDTVLTADQRAELLVKPAGLISATPTWWLPCFNDLAEKTAGLTVTPYGDAAANPADHPVAYFRPAWAQNVNRCIGLGV